MPEDFWWAVAANALGTVLGALVLGALLELGLTTVGYCERVWRQASRRIRIATAVVAFFTVLNFGNAAVGAAATGRFGEYVERWWWAFVLASPAPLFVCARLLLRILRRIDPSPDEPRQCGGSAVPGGAGPG